MSCKIVFLTIVQRNRFLYWMIHTNKYSDILAIHNRRLNT